MSERRPQTESELVEHVRALDEPAPAALHARIDALVAEHAARPARPSLAARLRTRPAALGAGVALLAALAAVLVLSVAGGGSSPALSWRTASALTLRGARGAAPAVGRDRAQLTAAVGGVAFPNWEPAFGWRTTGVRSDSVGGRQVTTVFYADGRGQRVGYAIAAGPAPGVSGGTIAWREGAPYRMLSAGAVQAVVWQRGGHMCVLAGRGVDGATLLWLASWSDDAGAS